MLGIIPFFLIFLLLQSFFRFVDPFVMTGSFILGVFVYKILGWEVFNSSPGVQGEKFSGFFHSFPIPLIICVSFWLDYIFPAFSSRVLKT